MRKTPKTMTNKFLSKDNFWNLMFWLMLVTGFVLSSIFEMPLISLVNLFVTPYIISKKQKVSLNKDAIFVNSEGQLLNDRYPVYAVWMLILSIASIFIMGFIIDSFKIDRYVDDEILTPVVLSMSLIPFIRYFIYINCPISIFFKLTAWHPTVLGFECSSGSNTLDPNRQNSAALKTFMNENPITDPRWSGSSSNIFNNSRR